MSEHVDFDTKIQGLANTYEALEALDFGRDMALGEGDSAIDPEHVSGVFYGLGIDFEFRHLRDGIRKTQERMAFDMGAHAVIEYGTQGHSGRALHEDTPEERSSRVGILTMMCVPGSQEEFFERAEYIAELFEAIERGETVVVNEHITNDIFIMPDQEFTADPARPLFIGIGGGGHISHRSVAFRYDSPETWDEEREAAIFPVLQFGLDAMFHSDELKVAVAHEQVA